MADGTADCAGCFMKNILQIGPGLFGADGSCGGARYMYERRSRIPGLCGMMCKRGQFCVKPCEGLIVDRSDAAHRCSFYARSCTDLAERHRSRELRSISDARDRSVSLTELIRDSGCRVIMLGHHRSVGHIFPLLPRLRQYWRARWCTCK